MFGTDLLSGLREEQTNEQMPVKLYSRTYRNDKK